MNSFFFSFFFWMVIIFQAGNILVSYCTMHCGCGESFNSSNRASKDLHLVGASMPVIGVHAWGKVWLCYFMWLQLSCGNHRKFITYYDWRLLILLHLLTMTTWKKIMLLWMVSSFWYLTSSISIFLLPCVLHCIYLVCIFFSLLF